jgi:membrane-associated phospholipid phosphatase
LWAVRTYALLSVAQHEAISTARLTRARDDLDARIVIATAVSSATVLAALYPHEVPRLAATMKADVESVRNRLSDTVRQEAASTAAVVAQAVLTAREQDGAQSLDVIEPPAGQAAWRSSEQWPALRPRWGTVRPMLIRDVSEFELRPPPDLTSVEFADALAAVRAPTRVASARNDEIVRKWADGPGTATPSGHWNEIASELIARDRLDEVESAQVLALMNMAMLDSSILCWRTKYHYWLLRPPQADPTITPSIALPNFPSYPSGHAAFSAAAATFLAFRFPPSAQALMQMADEAAGSRVLGGIHYPFDSAEGLRQGREVAALAIARYERGLSLLTRQATEQDKKQ